MSTYSIYLSIYSIAFIMPSIRTQRVIVGAGEEIECMNRVVRTQHERPYQYTKRARHADRATCGDGRSSSGRPGGRKGESHMEIKIIINEDGMDGATRRGAGRRGRWGHIPEGRREQRHDQTTHGRVIGKLIELPDGRVKIVGRRRPAWAGRQPAWAGRQPARAGQQLARARSRPAQRASPRGCRLWACSSRRTGAFPR